MNKELNGNLENKTQGCFVHPAASKYTVTRAQMQRLSNIGNVENATNWTLL